MGETMEQAVLRMPPALWTDDRIDVMQRHARYIAAADEILRLRAINAELTEVLRDYPVMLDECQARIEALLAAYREESKALEVYFDLHGIAHSGEDCPQDDTCDCGEHVQLYAAWDHINKEIVLAERRICKIKAASAALIHTKGALI